MNNLTLLETILIIYIIVVNVLGVVTIIIGEYASRKAGDIMFFILFGVAIPITLPQILYLLTFDKLKRRKKETSFRKSNKGVRK
mgnify:CR=1 FL=1